MNCRRDVEESLTRVAGRKMRRLRGLPECSVARCADFLASIEDEGMRLHLSSMAWWRFSSDGSPDGIGRIRKIMTACRPFLPEFGEQYLHSVLRVLSPLSPEQLATWFGHENLYQIVELFSGERPEITGSHCTKCKLYRLGCTAYAMIGADDCPYWKDAFVQSVASAVSKAGVWNNPCKGISDTPEAKGAKK